MGNTNKIDGRSLRNRRVPRVPRICKQCLIEKPFNEFVNGKKGYLRTCKNCRGENTKIKNRENFAQRQIENKKRYLKEKDIRILRGKEYRKNNPDATRSTLLKSKYGLTLDDYNKKLTEQNDSCAICGKHKSLHHEGNRKGAKKNLCVDHNHETGKVRGLLCCSCNRGLGYYENYKDKFKEYLEKYD